MIRTWESAFPEEIETTFSLKQSMPDYDAFKQKMLRQQYTVNPKCDFIVAPDGVVKALRPDEHVVDVSEYNGEDIPTCTVQPVVEEA